MLDTYGRKYVNPLIEVGAKFFLKMRLKANHITFLALLIGILTFIFIYFDMKYLAVIVLWISGYLDAVDGAMARKSKNTTDFGTLMDITFDRIVEISVILALAFKFEGIRMNLIVLTMCILISMTIFLTVGALSEKKGIKSFYYQAGVAERTEGFILFSLMIIFTNYVGYITNIFSLMIIVTVIQRMLEAKKILDK